jgi:hypothetical protein
LTLTIPKPATARTTKIKISDGAPKGGLFKNLIGEKKGQKEAIELKSDPTEMAN